MTALVKAHLVRKLMLSTHPPPITLTSLYGCIDSHSATLCLDEPWTAYMMVLPFLRMRVMGGCREATAVAFGLACLLPGCSQSAIAASLERGFGQPSIPLRDLAIRAWSLAVAGGMTDETWGRLVDCVALRHGSGLQLWGGEPELDDIASLFLVHAAMLVAGE